jgi:hypothetical protein
MQKLLTSLLLCGAGCAQAGDPTLSGFTTIAAGQAYSGDQGTFHDFRCPCFIANFEHGTVYERKRVSLAPESLAGLQLKYAFSDAVSGTVQVVARASGHLTPDIDWAYLTLDLSPTTTVQVGRRRLPLYAFSDSVDVGYSLPWVRVPQDVYGWEIGLYNGANLSERAMLGSWSLIGNVFAGQESTRDNREESRIFEGAPVDEAWKHIVGAYLDVSNEIVGVRLVYMQNSIDRTVRAPGQAPRSSLGTRQRVMGVAASIDAGALLVRAEANRFRHPAEDYSATSWSASIGYKVGKLTPLAGYSHYAEKRTEKYTAAQINNTRFLALRWDFRKDMDLKLQFDSNIDHSAFPFSGSAKQLTLALDAVF